MSEVEVKFIEKEWKEFFELGRSSGFSLNDVLTFLSILQISFPSLNFNERKGKLKAIMEEYRLGNPDVLASFAMAQKGPSYIKWVNQ